MIQFLFPAFLFALTCISVPILVHLFNFRKYKKLNFSNVALLKNMIQTSNNKRKLQEILILIARCLAIICLVLAFVQPFIQKMDKSKEAINYVSLYLDNSFSMNQGNGSENLIEKGKGKLRAIIENYSPNDQFQIISNEMNGSQFQWVNQQDAINRINSIQVSPAFVKLSSIYEKQRQSFHYALGKNFYSYLLSDFQKSSSNLSRLNDTLIYTSLVPIQAISPSNVYIDTAFFESPIYKVGQAQKLIFRIKNSSNSEKKIKPKLKFNGQIKSQSEIIIQAHSSILDSINITSFKKGFQEAELLINDFPLQFDDNYLISWNIPEKMNVNVINGNQENSFLTAAIKSSNQLEVTNMSENRINYSTIPSQNLVILNNLNTSSKTLNEQLLKYIESGGNVLIFPSTENNESIKAQSQYFSLGVNPIARNEANSVFTIETKDLLLQNVFEKDIQKIILPKTQKNYQISPKIAKGSFVVASYRNGNPYIVRYVRKRGQIILCASSLSNQENSLVTNGEIFVPIIHNAALISMLNQKLAYNMLANEWIEVAVNETDKTEITKMIGSQTFIPEQFSKEHTLFINLGKEYVTPGVYSLITKNKKILNKYAINFNRKESEMNFYSLEDLEKIKPSNVHIISPNDQNNLATIVIQNDRGTTFWKPLLFLTLLFLFIEIILARYFNLFFNS